jgi:hypothetical protein
VGIALSNAIVDQQPNRFSSPVAMNYRHHVYGIINQRLGHVSSRLSGNLQRKGHRALPIPSTQEDTCKEQLYGIFWHKFEFSLNAVKIESNVNGFLKYIQGGLQAGL